MDEILAIRQAIEQKRYIDALLLLGEMEEMSKDDKINKIRSFIIILLVHLIKKVSAQHTTRSWENSIFNSLNEIGWINKRRKTGGFYVNHQELEEVIIEAYPVALKMAATEAFEGIYDECQLEKLFNPSELKKLAFQLILEQQGEKNVI